MYLMTVASGATSRLGGASGVAFNARWSPDGRSIFFVSHRNGYLNVFGVPVSGRQVGNVFEVTHFDDPGRHIPNLIPMVGFSVAANRLMVTISRRSGNLWVVGGVNP